MPRIRRRSTWEDSPGLSPAFRLSLPVKRVDSPEREFPHRLPACVEVSPRPFFTKKIEALTSIWKLGRGAYLLFRDVCWADVIIYRTPSPLPPADLPADPSGTEEIGCCASAGTSSGETTTRAAGSGQRSRTPSSGRTTGWNEPQRANAKPWANGQALADKFQCDSLNECLIDEDQIKTSPKPLQGDRVRLLAVSRLDVNKGTVHLLEAARLLVDRGICRDRSGPGRNGTRRKSDCAGELANSGSRIESGSWGPLSFGEELFAQFDSADVLVISSFSEGLPKVLLEAMAFALPIVATNVGGIPELAGHGRSALLIEPGSGEQISRAVQRLIEDAELRTKLVRNGLETIRRNTRRSTLEALVERVRALARTG